MRFSSLSGTSGGVKRYGRWFVLAFVCVALVLVLVPALSYGWSAPPKVTLSACPSNVVTGGTAKLNAKVCPVPKHGTFTLVAKNSAGHITTVGSLPVGSCGTTVFTVKPVRNTSYQVLMTATGVASTSSNWACVKVCAKLTLCVKPAQYCAGLVINGTLAPGWAGGKVTIAITKVINCFHSMRVVTVCVPLQQGPGDTSVFAVTQAVWGGGSYVVNASVASTPDFGGACVSKCIRL